MYLFYFVFCINMTDWWFWLKSLNLLFKINIDHVALYKVQFDSPKPTHQISVLRHCRCSGMHKSPHLVLCSNTYTDILMVNVHHVSVKPLKRMCRLRLIFKHSPLPFFITTQQSQRCDSVIKQLRNVCVKDESGKIMTIYRFHKCVLRNSDQEWIRNWPPSSRKKRWQMKPCDILWKKREGREKGK